MWTLFLNFIKGIKWTPLKISIAINIVLMILVYFLFKSEPIKQPEVIVVEKIITIPGREGKLDTIYEPKFIEKKNPINKKLLEQYNQLRDSISKENLFIEAITEREYNEIYEDSFVKINTYTNVVGEILKQASSYKIKPTSIRVKDTISLFYDKPAKNKLLGGLEIGVPVNDDLILKGSIHFQNKKGNIITLGYDSKKTKWLGYVFKF